MENCKLGHSLISGKEIPWRIRFNVYVGSSPCESDKSNLSWRVPSAFAIRKSPGWNFLLLFPIEILHPERLREIIFQRIIDARAGQHLKCGSRRIEFPIVVVKVCAW